MKLVSLASSLASAVSVSGARLNSHLVNAAIDSCVQNCHNAADPSVDEHKCAANCVLRPALVHTRAIDTCVQYCHVAADPSVDEQACAANCGLSCDQGFDSSLCKAACSLSTFDGVNTCIPNCDNHKFFQKTDCDAQLAVANKKLTAKKKLTQCRALSMSWIQGVSYASPSAISQGFSAAMELVSLASIVASDPTPPARFNAHSCEQNCHYIDENLVDFTEQTCEENCMLSCDQGFDSNLCKEACHTLPYAMQSECIPNCDNHKCSDLRVVSDCDAQLAAANAELQLTQCAAANAELQNVVRAKAVASQMNTAEMARKEAELATTHDRVDMLEKCKAKSPNYKPLVNDRCNPKNCDEWNCGLWCVCYNAAHDEIYEVLGCTAADEETCQC